LLLFFGDDFGGANEVSVEKGGEGRRREEKGREKGRRVDRLDCEKEEQKG
jgi:hypothetical protein